MTTSSLHTATAVPAMLTIGDVAARLRLSTRTIRRMVTRGELPAHRVGRQIRTAEDALGRFLAHRRA